jgi:hypothetical protein
VYLGFYFSKNIDESSNQTFSSNIIFTGGVLSAVLEADTGMSKIGTFSNFKDF